jgi:CDP-diacylglycerol--serine O-phosphatidyltransferase
MYALIPNLLTLGNLLCGTTALVFFLFPLGVISEAALIWNAIIWLLLAALMDVLDGWCARLLRVNSVLGKELDSLADCVSFGVVPGILIYGHLYRMGTDNLGWYGILLWGVLPAGAAYRLAKFNLDVRESFCFYGLPTPANALYLIFLLYASTQTAIISNYLKFSEVWAIIIVIQVYLMLSNVRLMSLKIKIKNLLQLKYEVSLVFLAIISVFIFQWDSIIIIFFLYISISQLKYWKNYKFNT